MKGTIEELIMKNRNMEGLLVKKDEEAYKLRQDNQNMFSDLRGLSSYEETFKLELI